jgi:ABC-type nitrate/sulfonate/bicarbonate transport system substrate-binding protein
MTKPRITRRTLLGSGLATAATALGAPAIGRAQSKPLRLQHPWLPGVDSAGSYVAEQQSFFRDAKLDVSFLNGGPQIEPAAMLASGAADIALVSSPLSVVAARARGVPVVVIGAGQQRSPLGVTSLAASNLTAPKDFAGKKIGLQQVNRPWLRAVMKANKIAETQFETATVTADPTPLIERRIDFMTVSVLNVPLGLKFRGIETKSWYVHELGVPMDGLTLCCMEATLASRKSEIEAFTRALLKGWEITARDPDPIAKMVVEKYAPSLNLDHQLAYNRAQLELMTSPLTVQKGAFWMDRKAWDVANQIAIDAELIKDPVDLSKLLVYDVLEQIHGKRG